MANSAHTADECIPSDLAEGRRVQDDIEAVLHAAGYGDQDVFYIKLAMEEALVNAIKHGNQLDPSKKVCVSYTVTSERFDCRIVDEGPGFDPGEVPDPTLPENLDRPCGRGLFLIRRFMTDVTYHGKGNVVTMCRVRAAAE